MVVSSLEENITWIKLFPKKNRISNTLSPSAIVLEAPKIDDNHAKSQPGLYGHCKIKARSTNSTKTRSVAAITLRRSNKRSGNYLMFLETGR